MPHLVVGGSHINIERWEGGRAGVCFGRLNMHGSDVQLGLTTSHWSVHA